MTKKTYPALYTTCVKGTNFHHSGIYPTLYFKILPDEQRYQNDLDYREYMDFISNEPYDAIANKFLLSIPTKITNDKQAFLLFKTNVDIQTVKQFCIAMLDEINYFTGTNHKADYYMTETILLEIGKTPSIFKSSKIGEKLTKTNLVSVNKIILEGSSNNNDNGILTSFETYLYMKNQNKNEEQDNDEEIVVW